MRGNCRNQAGQIFRKLDRIGQARHTAKQEAKAAGIASGHATGQAIGIYSFATMTKYRSIGTQFLQWCRDEHGLEDAASVQPVHVQQWLQIKIASGVRYKTYSTYAAALGKMSAGLNAIYKRDHRWTTAIESTRQQARSSLGRDVKSRGYDDPQAIIDGLNGVYKIAAELQYVGGCRVKECSHLTEKNLIGNGIILLTNTKGGRRRKIQLTSELYKQVAEIIKGDGEFSFQYKTYLRRLRASAFESEQFYASSHSLRWNFCQREVVRAQGKGLSYDESLSLVSKKMGHSRKSISQHYLQ